MILKVRKTDRSVFLNKEQFNFSGQSKKRQWYILGEIFYIVKNNSIIQRDQVSDNIINSVFLKYNYDISKFKNTVEGHYICIIINDKNVKVFGDKFNRKNVFYCDNQTEILFDTKMSKELITNSGKEINRQSLFSYFLIGYGHGSASIFKNINRLGYDKYFQYNIHTNSYEIIDIFQPLKIENYDQNNLKEFEDLFKNSIKTRMGEKNNWVCISGGWDSTLIVDTLLRYTDRKNVKTATDEIYYKDGRSANIYEIEKVKKIAKHYGLKNYVFKVDLRDNSLIDLWRKYITKCMENHVFQWPINHLGICDFILDIDADPEVIFNGEVADSFQNYGFSQYNSIHSGNSDFDEYADKMKTYLYGPTFLKEIKSGSFHKNKIYQIFKKLNLNQRFLDENSEYSRVIFSFLYSPSRLPFTTFDENPILRKRALDNFVREVFENYIYYYSEKITEKNIYSIWNALYADYHLRGLSVPMSIFAIEDISARAALPFYDLQLARYFEKMPESWGKGLNFNSAKYVEKSMAFKSKTYPIHIVNAPTTHSYIHEDDPSINPYFEYYCNSSITEYFREILSENDSIDFLRNVDGINVEYINKIVHDFLDNRLSFEDFPILSRVAVLTSAFKEYFNY